VQALLEKRVSERPVAGFNLVAVSGDEAVCLHYDGALRPVPLGPGAHVVSTNRDLDDPAMPEKQVFDRFLGADPAVADWMPFLTSHEGARPVCKHGDQFGTVSSAVYTETDRGRQLLHADGPPCRTPYRDFSALLG
jgi:hypothetical protein